MSLLLNSNKAYKIIFKTMFDVRKEHIALHILYYNIIAYLYYNICTTIIAHITLLILGEIWRKRCNLTSLILVVFAEVGKVNVEVLDIKSYQPQQKHCRGSYLDILFAAGKNADSRADYVTIQTC